MSWERKRITVVTKAYPEHSTKHGDVACTAGITDDGEWIRLYPIDMRHFIGEGKISKWDIIEAEVEKDNDKLGRKESHRVRPDSIRVVDRRLTKPKVDWKGRSGIILPRVSESIGALKRAFERDRTSLGAIKPSALLDFVKTDELQIFERTSWSFTLTLDGQRIPNVANIPHIFKYRFRCPCCVGLGDEHMMQCEDWELFESYRSWGVRYGTPDVLWTQLRSKFLDEMIHKKDLHFIMGTHSQYPTWFIIGLYYPPKG